MLRPTDSTSGSNLGPPSTASPEGLRGADLVAWFTDRGRDLPWRRTRDPWRILVAESMLQQTQVARVVDRWPRFLDRFPDPEACATAPVADVITEWAGLGYNRRAVNLHRSAVLIVERHGGRVPQRLDELLLLPGIGSYTARAVRVFAFETDDAVLDTNVARILARLAGRRWAAAEAQSMADDVLGPDPWVWNQAMLDVGAGWCRPRDPGCDRGCPLRPACRWATDGRPEPDPATGSAGVSGRQSRFEGSDRQGRGRLVAALRSGPVGRDALAEAMGWPDDRERAVRVAASVVEDGLAIVNADGALELPT